LMLFSLIPERRTFLTYIRKNFVYSVEWGEGPAEKASEMPFCCLTGS
jgi:hypothetical protein